jgi:hypothetical protein
MRTDTIGREYKMVGDSLYTFYIRVQKVMI